MNRVKVDALIIDKCIKSYKDTQKKILELAASNKTLADTRDGLKAIIAVLGGATSGKNN